MTKTTYDDDIDIQVSIFNPKKNIFCSFKEITKDSLLVARKKYNLLVFVWTVKNIDIDIMIDLGVDVIVTDYPPLATLGYRGYVPGSERKTSAGSI